MIKEDTAEMMCFPDGKVDVEMVKQHFNRFMVKDSVKSTKGTEFPAFSTSTLTTRHIMKTSTSSRNRQNQPLRKPYPGRKRSRQGIRRNIIRYPQSLPRLIRPVITKEIRLNSFRRIFRILSGMNAMQPMMYR